MNWLKPRFSIAGLLLLILVAAVGIATHRKYYVPPLEQISGLDLLAKTKRRQQIAFDQHANRTTASHLIGQLSHSHSLCFYDLQYDSPSDPGVFIEVMRHDANYVLQLRNHGWSSDWVIVTKDEAIDLLWSCREYNGPDRRESLLPNGMQLYGDAKRPNRINPDRQGHAAEYVRQRIGN
ncbi:MAG: hypothetical protein HKN47_16670 [Pirellulaceae bacterium]|nr:hypothetical protein [Pirellulaceae bacterium]